MSITLTPTGESPIVLPDDLIWQDEGQWQAALSNRTVTTTGAQIIQGGAQQAGRPITLAGSVQHAWMSRAAWLALLAEADVYGAQYLLKLHDEREFDVQWAPGAQRITAQAVIEYANPLSTDPYWAVLRFITV